nr:hypothetical protein [Anaerobutyricum hallii]
MEENKTSVLSNGLIWFGAGVSMSEILTGTYFAPLGMKLASGYFNWSRYWMYSVIFSRISWSKDKQ